MASSAMLKLLCVGLLGMLILAPHAEAVIDCGQVYNALIPCLGYLRGQRLDSKCCSNMKGLYGQARTKPDRQSICGCLKRVAGNYNIGKAKELVSKCGVNVPYPIDPSIDCSKIRISPTPIFFVLGLE